MKALGLRKAITSFLPPHIPTQATGDCCKTFYGQRGVGGHGKGETKPLSWGKALWGGGWGGQHSRFPAEVTP